ncbi:MAG: mechanosensitive ion channel [Actinomycetota bacterium]|nr:mechanosensitive ion channel [Actinomycetota bacterium]
MAIIVILSLSIVAYRVGCTLIHRVVHFRVRKKEEMTPEAIATRKKAHTLETLFQNLLKYLIFFICGFMILKELGVDPVPMIAAAGVVGIALGFGAQSLVRDVVSGFFILFESQYAVDDLVHLKAGPYEAYGIVEEFGLRVTKIRDLNGNLHYVPNGSIVGVDRYTHGYLAYNLDFTLPTDIEESEAKEALSHLSKDLVQRQHFLLAPPKMLGVIPFADKILVRIRIYIVPFQDRVIDECVQHISQELKATLGLGEIPPPAIYQISEEALSKYKKSIVIK